MGLISFSVSVLHEQPVATPKQIRELMKVDGLTNDEVKSHLQVHLSLSLRHAKPVIRQDFSYSKLTTSEGDVKTFVLEFKLTSEEAAQLDPSFLFSFSWVGEHRNTGFILDDPAQARKQPAPPPRSWWS